VRDQFKPAVCRILPNRADYATRHGLCFHDLRHTCASLLIVNVDYGSAWSCLTRLISSPMYPRVSFRSGK
jgi:integrase